MAASITFDFRHYYQKGDRRSSGQIAYQWDLGHTAEIYVPVNASYEIHYCFHDYTQTEDYAVESIAAAEDGGYKLTAHIPNKYFERSGELRVYVIGSADDHILTTYEGFITIRGRIKPDDYTDDDPENGAETIIARARRYANESEAWAVGQIEGTDVPSTDPQYNNNSKYYATQAATSASQASTSASQASGSASSASSYASRAANSMNIADQAAGAASEQAQSASSSAQTASTQATKAQSYAVGGTGSRTGESTDNAKYYKEQAEAAAASILENFAHYQATLTADKAYKVGEYLTYNGYLYRVTTAIASGGTISPGTNCVQTSVGDEVANYCLRFENVAVSATTGDIATITDARITADHVVAECVWGDASAITTDVTCTISAGSAVLNGTCTAATTATVTLVKKCN